MAGNYRYSSSGHARVNTFLSYIKKLFEIFTRYRYRTLIRHYNMYNYYKCDIMRGCNLRCGEVVLFLCDVPRRNFIFECLMTLYCYSNTSIPWREIHGCILTTVEIKFSNPRQGFHNAIGDDAIFAGKKTGNE